MHFLKRFYSNPRPFSSERAKSGFTLIELLLGLLVFSIIAVSLYSTFAGGLAINKRSRDRNTFYREVRWVMEEISRDLENSVPYDFSGSHTEFKAFQGGQEAVQFLVAEQDGLKFVRYSLAAPNEYSIRKTIIGKRGSLPKTLVANLTERRDTRYLVRQEASFLEFLSDGFDKASKEILSLSVKGGGLSFNYKKLHSTEEGIKEVIEQDLWEETGLPKMVRVRLEFIDPDNVRQNTPVVRDIFIPAGG